MVGPEYTTLYTEGISEPLPASPDIRVPAELPQIEEGRGSSRAGAPTDCSGTRPSPSPGRRDG